jgi:hypothetical protein
MGMMDLEVLDMSYYLQVKTGFFKTYRCRADLVQNGIKLHAIEPNDADIFVAWESVDEVSFLRVNDRLVEMILNSTDKSYTFRLLDLNQAIAIADQMRNEFGIKVYLE